MTSAQNPEKSAQIQIGKYLGLYKAEWLNGELFQLFTEPEYLNELMIRRPCVLIGGRGTGKTTVLRGLSYEGVFARGANRIDAIADSNFIGLYYRANTNRVTALVGPELEEHEWIKCFAHYMNLTLSDLIVKFGLWYEQQAATQLQLPPLVLKKFSASMHIGNARNLEELAERLAQAHTKFEANINSIADERPKQLSLQGAPLDILADAFMALPQLKGKQFFFLIDEYENFVDYQQQVLNTLIKHSSPSYTFKIGARELGWRIRKTLNPNESLSHPGDYVKIDIRQKLDPKKFSAFAETICNSRLSRVQVPGLTVIPSIAEALPGLSADEEATLLGAAEGNRATLDILKRDGTPEEFSAAQEIGPAMLHLLRFWADSGNGTLIDVFRDYQDNPEPWKGRYNNYMYSALFTIRRRKSGTRKHYAGWKVFTRIADGNIRFLLELVHQSFLGHFAAGGSASRPILPETQTVAAASVGRKNLEELDGVSDDGAKLTKLLLSLGRIFQVMADKPEGHAPEVTQFYLAEPLGPTAASDLEEAEQLLKSAIMHQALVRTPGNKLLGETDTKEYDYAVHPIFSPYFVYSHRRKRKMHLSSMQFLGLVKSHKATISEILSVNHRRSDEPLPDQMKLFEGFYGGNSI